MTPRKKAATEGKTTFEGLPCRKCGSTTRYTSNGQCCACVIATAKAKHKMFKELLAKARGEKGV